MTAIECMSTAGTLTVAPNTPESPNPNPPLPAYESTKRWNLDIRSLAHAYGFTVKGRAKDAAGNWSSWDSAVQGQRAHAIDLLGQPQVAMEMVVEYPAGNPVESGAEVCNTVKPRLKLQVPTPNIPPTWDYVQIIMQESPQHPGQRATTEPPLDEAETVVNPDFSQTIRYTWDTGGWLLNNVFFTNAHHNGTWEARGTAQYHWWNDEDDQGNPITRTLSTEPAPEPPPGPWNSASPFPVTARNVTITAASCSGGVGEAGDYWLFDPEGYSPENPPQLALTFETDKLVNEPATATLKIYDADRDEDTPLKEITAAASTHAAGQQITWNGLVDGQLVGKGIYVFDLHVSSDANPLILDSDDHKSQTLKVADDYLTPLTFTDPPGTVTMGAGYVLTDSEPPVDQAASVRVEFFYLPTLERRAGPTAGPTVVNPVGAPNPVWNELTETFALSWAEDDCACAALMSPCEQSSCNKRHEERPALQRNAEPDYTVLGLKFMNPDYSAPQEWSAHIYKQGDRLYPQLRAGAPREQQVPGEVRVRMKSSETDTFGVHITLPHQREAGGNHYYHANAGVEPSVGYPTRDVPPEIMGVHNSPEGVGEQTTSDIGNAIDSDALTVFSETRGYGRDYAQEPTDADTRPILFGNLEYLQAAGVEHLTVWSLKDPAKKDRVPAKNQADLLYYSGHGERGNGKLKDVYDPNGEGDPPRTPCGVSDINPSANWGDDLETFVIAGCGVLDNLLAPYPGLTWANNCLVGRSPGGPLLRLLGYHYRSPLDGHGSEEVADLFSYLESEGHSLIDAWMQANAEKDAWYACAFSPTTYSYFQYPLFRWDPKKRRWDRYGERVDVEY